MSVLSDFRNQLAGFDQNFAESKIEDSHISVPVMMNYPSGGGYLEAHQDLESFQKLIIMIMRSYAKSWVVNQHSNLHSTKEKK